jgi:hypothetical protein
MSENTVSNTYPRAIVQRTIAYEMLLSRIGQASWKSWEKADMSKKSGITVLLLVSGLVFGYLFFTDNLYTIRNNPELVTPYWVSIMVTICVSLAVGWFVLALIHGIRSWSRSRYFFSAGQKLEISSTIVANFDDYQAFFDNLHKLSGLMADVFCGQCDAFNTLKLDFSKEGSKEVFIEELHSRIVKYLISELSINDFTVAVPPSGIAIATDTLKGMIQDIHPKAELRGINVSFQVTDNQNAEMFEAKRTSLGLAEFL